jgi:tRNA A58 N-methylase Trm61
MRALLKMQLFGLLLLPLALGTPAFAAPDAEEILAATNVRGGLIVQIGVGDGSLCAALRRNDSYIVQGLDADAFAVQKARESLRAKGQYGPVSVDRFDGKALPYIEDFVNLVVAEELGERPVRFRGLARTP